MIYCPNCGTANREGSRFCNECGATLPTDAGIRCPMCGEMNPVSNVYCDKCNARLIPLTADQQPPGQPAPPSAQEEPPPVTPPGAAEEGTADWLAELRAGVGETAAEERAPEAEVPSADLPDWLAEPEAVPPPGEKPTGGPQPEADWLAELRAEAAEEPQPAEPTAAGSEPVPAAEIPDWLAELEAEPTPPAAEEPPSAAEPAKPDWLAEAEEPEPTAQPQQPAPAPEWLAELETEPTPPAAEEPPSAAESEMPDWLAGLEPPPAAPPAAGEEEEGQVPDWLAELQHEPPAEPEATAEAETPAAAAFTIPAEEGAVEIPDWLASPEAEVGEPETEEERAQVLDWLQEPAPTAPVFSSDEGVPEEVEAASLDWLEELTKEEEVAAAEAPPLPDTSPLIAPPEMEGLVPAEIPEWLEALRPKTEAEAEAGGPPETEGLLKGLRGTLAPSLAVSETAAAGPAPAAAPSAAARARADLLRELLNRPPAVPKPEKAEGKRIAWAVVRAVIAILLLGAIAVPMLIPSLFSAPVTPAVGQLFETIEQTVGDGTTVLVAFEYGPAEADEMNWVAAPILRHAVARGGHLLLASTRPEGPATAQMLVAHVLTDTLQDESQVTVLGYRPGGTAGVQEILSSTSDDIALVIVLAARPDDLRTWVEQVTLSDPDLPLVAGMSAKAEPLTSPYLSPQAGQLRAAIAGIAGGAAYESRLGNPQNDDLTFLLNWLGTAQLVIVGLMVAGAFIFLAGGRRP